KKGGQYWVWTCAYTLFTGVFTFIAIYTFISFLHKNGSVIVQAGQVDPMTIVRALSGWLYALGGMLHAGVKAKYGKGHEGGSQQAPNPPQVDVQQLVTEAMEKAANEQKQALDALRTEQQQVLQMVQGAQNSGPSITPEALIEAVTTRLVSHFEAR